MRGRIGFFILAVSLCAMGWLSWPSRTRAAAVTDNPSQAAWLLFANINRPAADGASVLWENWALKSDLFPEFPACPKWPAAHNPFKVFAPLRQEELLLMLEANRGQGKRQLFDVTDSSEVRLNCSVFTTVVANDLWHRKGLLDRAAAIAAGTKAPIRFEADAIAVKAKWRQWNGSEDLTHFHTGKDANGQVWVLVGLHVTSRPQDTWFWATWEYKDNPAHQHSTDNFGYLNGSDKPSDGLAVIFAQNHLTSEWSYYRLIGAQTDYTSPPLLGNSEIEKGFLQSSSCMTCHFRAGIFTSGRAVSSFDSHGNGYTGKPQPPLSAIQGDAFEQTDFLWSLTGANGYLGSAPHLTPSCSDPH